MEENKIEVIDEVEVVETPVEETEVSVEILEESSPVNTGLAIAIGGLAVYGTVCLGKKAWNGGKKLAGKVKAKYNEVKAEKDKKDTEDAQEKLEDFDEDDGK